MQQRMVEGVVSIMRLPRASFPAPERCNLQKPCNSKFHIQCIRSPDS